MVLDIIGAAVLIAFGFIAVFFSVNEAGDEKFLLILLIGILAVFADGYSYQNSRLPSFCKKQPGSSLQA